MELDLRAKGEIKVKSENWSKNARLTYLILEWQIQLSDKANMKEECGRGGGDVCFCGLVSMDTKQWGGIEKEIRE